MKVSPLAVILLMVSASVALAGCTTTPPAASTTAQPPVPVTTPAGAVADPATDTRHIAGLTNFVENATAYAKTHGRAAALREFNDINGTFIKGELYVFAYDINGTVLAWPSRPDQIGADRANATDPNGVKHIAWMIAMAKQGGGYLYYITANPADAGRQEFKIAYIKPVDDTWFVGSGTYLPYLPAQFDATEKDRLIERVKAARQHALANGAAKAVADFNDKTGTFADGSRYIFAYGFNGTTLAMPFQSEVIGTDRTGFADTYGVKVTAWEIAAAKAGGGFVYVNYYNPDTGKAGFKLCYVEPVDDSWFVGSGTYTDRM